MDADKGSTIKAVFFIIFGMIAVFFAAFLSIVFGTADISFQVVWNAIFHIDASNSQHQVIRDLRIPRTIADIAVGAAFATAGAIMQGLTRNPLADSGLLGINAGASFAIAVCFAFFPGVPYYGLAIFSFLGASMAAGIVFGITSLNHGKMTPIRLVLSGSAVGIFLSSLSQAIAMYYDVGQAITFWTSGGVAGIRMPQLVVVVPVIVCALAVAICLSRSVSVLSLGEDVAKGLGLSVVPIKIMCMLVVLVLAGVSVSLAGPISFVGLMIPHMVRSVVGVDYRRIIPCCMVAGSLFLLIADIVSRTINPPQETPIGLIFAIIGVPFFIYVTRKEGSKLNG